MFNAKAFYVTVVLLILSGCSSVDRQHHLLSAANIASNADADQQHRQQTIAIRQVRLPEYLNEHNLIYQTSSQTVVIDKNQLWAQDLSDNIKRVVQQNLTKQLPSASIYSYPLSANLRPERIVDIQIIELIANKDTNTLKLLANWQVIKPMERNPASHTVSNDYSMDENSVATIVNGYQQALADLSVEIVRTL